MKWYETSPLKKPGFLLLHECLLSYEDRDPWKYIPIKRFEKSRAYSQCDFCLDWWDGEEYGYTCWPLYCCPVCFEIAKSLKAYVLTGNWFE